MTRGGMIVAAATLVAGVGWLQVSSVPAGARRATPPQVKLTVEAKEFSFSAPKRIPSGMVRITIDNQGGEVHQAQVARLKDGATFEQVKEAAKTSANDPALLDLVDVMGGPNGVAPGRSATVFDDLTPGKYALICFVRSADGVSHYARGMVGSFTVTTKQGSTKKPKAAATIDMSEFEYTYPKALPRKGVVEVRNVGDQAHELGVFKVDEDLTLEEARVAVLGAAGAGKPEAEAMGGIVGLGPGDTGYMQLDLPKGRYVAICFFPDPTKANAPHFLEGMFQELNVK